MDLVAMCGKRQYGQPPGGDRDTGMAEWDTGSLNWQCKGDTRTINQVIGVYHCLKQLTTIENLTNTKNVRYQLARQYHYYID